MYLWNTKALATKLRDGTLTERERLKYYLLFMMQVAVVAELPYYSPEPVTPTLIAVSALSIVGQAIGIYVTYRANRSGDDRDFIARSVCLFFPVGLRVLAASMVIYMAYRLAGSMIGGEAFDRFATHTTWVDVGFYGVVEVVLYWRLWHHFTWIARSGDAA